MSTDMETDIALVVLEPASAVHSSEPSSNNPKYTEITTKSAEKNTHELSSHAMETEVPKTVENIKDSDLNQLSSIQRQGTNVTATDPRSSTTESAPDVGWIIELKPVVKASATNNTESAISTEEVIESEAIVIESTSSDKLIDSRTNVTNIMDSAYKVTTDTESATENESITNSETSTTESFTKVAYLQSSTSEYVAKVANSTTKMDKPATIIESTTSKESFANSETSTSECLTNVTETVTSVDKPDTIIEQPAASAIQTPANAMEVEIRTDNSVYLDKQGSKVRIDSPKPSTSITISTIGMSPAKLALYSQKKSLGFYDIPKKYMTPPIIPKNLPAAFESMKFLSSFEKSNGDVDRKKVLKDFVGSSLDDETFTKLEMYCNPDHLKSGREITMDTPYPFPSKTHTNLSKLCEVTEAGERLNTVVKTKLRNSMDKYMKFRKKLLYRGVRFQPPEENQIIAPDMNPDLDEPPLVPGKDLIYKIRIYKPFPYNPKKRVETVTRNPMLSHDLIVHGRQTLEVVRDQFRCANDLGLRIDMSNQPDVTDSSLTSCREIFPSAFLFINNVFYDDTRPGCNSYSSAIREWANRKGIGQFPAKPLNGVVLQDLEVRLGYPEVFIHQGDCEHLFSFSQIRLVGPDDSLDPNQYPKHRILSNNQIIYCTTCGEFVAKWVVTGSERSPFDPAFYCDTCFKPYMYKDQKKLGDFKAYSFIANDTSKF